MFRIKKLLISFELLVIVIPILLLGNYMYSSVSDSVTNIYELKNDEIIALEVESIKSYVQGIENLGKVMGSLSFVTEALEEENPSSENIKRINDLASAAVEKLGYIKEIYFTDIQGHIIGSNNTQFVGEQLVHEKIEIPIETKKMHTEVITDRLNKRVLILYIPILSEDNVEGMIIEKISINYFNRILQTLKGQYILDIMLMTDQNELIASYQGEISQNYEEFNPSDKIEGTNKKNKYTFKTLNNSLYQMHVEKIDDTNLYVISIVDYSSLQSDITLSLTICLIIGALLLIVLFLGKMYILEVITSEINNLKNIVRYTNYNNWSMLKFNNKIYEVNELKESFNQLAEEVVAKNEKILKDSKAYKLFFEKIRHHIYEIDLVNKRVTHRGNMFIEHINEEIYINEEYVLSLLDLHPNDKDIFYEKHFSLLHRHIPMFDLEVRIKLNHEDFYRWVNIREEAIYQMSKNAYAIIGFITDIDHQKNLMITLKEMAEQDGLTKVHNKKYFEEYVTRRLTQAEVNNAYLIMVDLDDFKQLNDSYGHYTADQILIFIAQTLDCEFGAKENMNLVSRFGGDEFVIWAENMEDIDLKLRRIKEQLNKGSVVNDLSISVSASMGGVKVNRGDDYASLLEKADALMYKIKKESKNSYYVDENNIID
ncbi:MAG: sensor domain-containing diguanylate cyclase [Cellulosilyticaceae bacterium]